MALHAAIVYESTDNDLRWGDLTEVYPPYRLDDGDAVARAAGRVLSETKLSQPVQSINADRLTVGKTSHVFLQVVDILGRQVTTLVDQVVVRGSQSVHFNATSLPSGMYFYRLETGGFQQTRKLVLLR